jgi:hypothetical protein
MSCLSSLGLIAATIYSLRIVQKVFLGNKNTDWKMNDLTLREKVVSALMVIAIVWLGLFPQPVLDTAKPALLKTLNKQKAISYQNQGSRTHDCIIIIELFNHRGHAPQPPQGGANTLLQSMIHIELYGIIPPEGRLILWDQLELNQIQRINPP